jgi:L-serine dehydratase
MVPGLCATHIGGAILVGRLASHLALHTQLPVNVPVDVMMAMAAAVHPVSAKHVVPVVIQYMEPFFRGNPAVEKYIDADIKAAEDVRQTAIRKVALEQARDLARSANSVIKPFGTAVVGGSSQAVGSPTNAGRLAHHLSRGRITKVKIELYPELFARRGINVPGVLMGAAYGASTADGAMYRSVMDRILADGIEVQIRQVEEYQVQRVTIEAGERNAFVDARNRGGGRLALVHVEPDMDEALRLARELEIEIVE